MKKTLSIFAIVLALFSCNNAPETKEFKTAYVDTSKLMEESTEAKDIEAKYKSKSEEKGSRIKEAADRLEAEKNSFQSNAQKNGQVWAQQKYAELQQRNQEIQYASQALMQELQAESGQEMDSLVKRYKKMFKDYGKEKGFDYIFGTGDVATVLYAKDSYDITKDLIKLVNDKYKSEAKSETKDETKKEDKTAAKDKK
ncbi:OmpH family outer membrane protein [Flavobacterium croceum]|uniref:Periplasmic chaperone for outer membrane proteins Skp n=1 Tax=Flavobacterium croceum DSM 17960 TaxID=1121886 RepID=A0A2S4NBC7_9FLAO|nr:OmpH family outer membrane protein [Flavobacterium croceum]POS03002.1 periplasmic chaperone for outer membrane proteins Skp [Flavobacterium croceum DSM 17960]